MKLLAVLPVLLLCLHSAGATRLTLLGTDETRIADEYIIGFHDDAASVGHFNAVLENWEDHFAMEPHQLGGSLGVHMLHVTMDEVELARAEEELQGVDYIHHDLKMYRHQTTQQPTQPGLDRIDSATGLDGSYTYLSDGTGVDIFILDTGVDTGHRGWGANQASFLADCALSSFTCSTTVDPGDPDSHGTHVAGTAASPEFGVAKGARIRSVRVLGADGSGSTAGIINGVNLVVATRAREGNSRPGVINMSLGGGFSQGFNNALNAAVRGDNDDPITIVVAAGNENQDARNVSPASASEVITVGSSQSNDVRSSFSNFGSAVDIFAVGTRVTSLRTNTDGTLTISGTSMASPHVAGAAAQLLSADPSRSPQDVKDILIATSTPNVLSSLPTATPNRLLNVEDARFASSVEEELPETEATETDPPVVETPDVPSSGACFDTLDAFGGTFQSGFLVDGVMFDLEVDADSLEGNTAPSLESVVVYSLERIDGGLASVYFTTDRLTYQRNNVVFSSGAWTPVTNSDGQMQTQVTSDDETVTLGGFTFFSNTIVLPEAHELTTGAPQGIYVVFLSEDTMVHDGRGLSTTDAVATDGTVSLIPGRIVAGMFSTRALSGALPLVNLCYSATDASLADVEVPSDDSSAPRLNDELDCLQSESDDASILNNQNGVMFDLTVDELAAADLPGVYLESFSVFLMDTMEGGVAEVWTTVNGESYLGQELDSDAWVMLATVGDVDMELDEGESGGSDTVDGIDDDASDVDEDINDIEQPSDPELLDLDLEMHYALRTDGTAQGFYVTFVADQMEYYSAEQAETATIASNSIVAMTGGKGVEYPFAAAFEQRQFAGEACFAYADAGASAASSVAVPPTIALIAALTAAVSLLF